MTHMVELIGIEEEHYTDWIYEYKQDEYLDDPIDDFVNPNEDDEDYTHEFIEEEGIEERLG